MYHNKTALGFDLVGSALGGSARQSVYVCNDDYPRVAHCTLKHSSHWSLVSQKNIGYIQANMNVRLEIAFVICSLAGWPAFSRGGTRLAAVPT